MSATNAFETALLSLIFNNVALANVGNAAGLQPSGVAGSVFLSLHTADPGEAGDQTTNETNYGGYGRVAITRSAGGWTIAGANATLTAQASFPACTSLTSTITHFGIGSAASGTGSLYFKGAVSPSISVSTGVTPILNTGTVVSCD